MEDEEFLTLKRVAAILDYEISTIRRWIKDERLRAVKIGSEWRVARSDLRAFIAQYEANQEDRHE